MNDVWRKTANQPPRLQIRRQEAEGLALHVQGHQAHRRMARPDPGVAIQRYQQDRVPAGRKTVRQGGDLRFRSADAKSRDEKRYLHSAFPERRRQGPRPVTNTRNLAAWLSIQASTAV